MHLIFPPFSMMPLVWSILPPFVPAFSFLLCVCLFLTCRVWIFMDPFWLRFLSQRPHVVSPYSSLVSMSFMITTFFLDYFFWQPNTLTLSLLFVPSIFHFCCSVFPSALICQPAAAFCLLPRMYVFPPFIYVCCVVECCVCPGLFRLWSEQWSVIYVVFPLLELLNDLIWSALL